MNQLIIAPPATYSPDYKSAPLTPRLPGELSPSKIAAPSGALGVATGSLPVSSAEALCRVWQNREQSHQGAAVAEQFSASGDMRHTYAANAYRDCVAMLRREMARAIKRQPEENK